MLEIKNYKDKELRYFLVCIGIAFIILHNIESIPFQDTRDLVSIANGAIVIAFMTMISVVVDGCIGSRVKDFLLYPFSLEMPGEKIFSEIRNGFVDKRFAPDKASAKYKGVIENIPDGEKERRLYENTQWYRIYNTYREKAIIQESQREYLLLRDMYIYALTVTNLYIVMCTCTTFINVSWSFIILIAVVSILSFIGAHKKAVTFVRNVIAIDIASEESK